ncbi:hypothetical protein DPEC_G00139730 [Dallia pectoralis]|uniref:Uncharacterized protein n=1 Tax=Dallia pectoralis TaxID=75939 RepID=A0ACC2GML5_DALPE|nr:hypothetical protein DPEC_G00139730 [Dallia pectoralis]
MAAVRAKSFHLQGSLMRCRSEGTLIDLDDNGNPHSNNLNGSNILNEETKHSEWPVLQPEVKHESEITNPFWKKLSASNPFLDDIVHSNDTTLSNADISIQKEEPSNLLDAKNFDTVSTSSDETHFGNFADTTRKSIRQSGRWRSAADILSNQERKEPKRENSRKGSFLNPDFEWLKNDREAYKMAWLSHRQLARSCLDLGLMSQSPGWAQTQATDSQIVCKIGHSGGSLLLPDSDITAHVPEGHVPVGEVQELTLKATLEPPNGLNTNYTTTVSPLVEVCLSNMNCKESITLEMKMAAEVKKDPVSQVMTTIVGLVSSKKEGPYEAVKDCYVYRNIMQMKLHNLKSNIYVIVAAETLVIEPPATSVWDYLDRDVTVAVYGPKHIHPSFKVVVVISCHNNVPPRLPFSDVRRGNRNLPPLVLELWGKLQFSPERLNDLHVTTCTVESNFEVKAEDKRKEVREGLLKLGKILQLPLELTKTGSGGISSFKLNLQVRDSHHVTVAEFQVLSPEAAPIRSEKRGPWCLERQNEICGSVSIPEETVPEYPKFRTRPVKVPGYAVALKSVIRQPRVEYLLEYFKGDTVALLSRDTVRSIGQSKVKEWYVGFLRGRVGLIHCKNFKQITRDQVIDFTGLNITTETLLENMVLPFKKLTYMYSAIQTLVTENICSWKGFADVLGYSSLSLDTITRRHAETEAEKVACVLETLKEDCHAERSRKKFQHELIVGLLKIDSQSLVAHVIQNTVILSTAVELGSRWRELAERLGKLSSSQIAGYEAPHRGKNGEVSSTSMWKPAYDFLYAWREQYGESNRDMIQELHLALDKMKGPITRHWRQLTGALITVNCLEILRVSAFPQQ